jgi:D-xylulose reductase
MQQEKLNIAARYSGLRPINVAKENAVECVRQLTNGWGADVVFEASGHAAAYGNLLDFACPGATVVLVGMPEKQVAYDVIAAQAKELHVEHVFRYTNVYPRAIGLLAAGKIDVKPLISRTFPFEKSVEAFEFAAQAQPDIIKIQIVFK